MIEFSLEDLQFAARYPFSNTAKRIVQRSNLAIDDIDITIKEIAKGALKAALTGRAYPVCEHRDKETLVRYILAYPVARVLVSFLENPKYYFYFARAIYKATLDSLKKAPDQTEEAKALANDFGINFGFNGYFELDLMEFLRTPSKDELLKLVNQKVHSGTVFLSPNRFSRFLAERAQQSVLSTLPVSTHRLPSELRELAFETLDEALEKAKATISTTANLSALPPCIEKIYSELLAGNNIPHMARFALATFLNAINVPEEKIIEAFSHAPNYNEKITRYQVSRIVQGKAGKRYRPLSCAKMRSYALCNANCDVKNPMQYYRRQLATSSRGG